jgi:multiple sugar transport system ATP-binding protein
MVGEQRLMACLPPRSSIAGGEDLTLFFDEDVAHLFEPETGKAIA